MAPPKWKTEVVSSHKFDFINIEDFHSASYLSYLRYLWLEGWMHLVAQAPRQAINIMTLAAFLNAHVIGLNRQDELYSQLPRLIVFTFYVMAFTSLVFVISAFLTLVAFLIWVPLTFKIQGNLKRYVCYKMNKRIDTIIKETIQERAREAQILEHERDESCCNNGSPPRTQRARPTLPNIDVILANTNQDDRRYLQGAYQQQRQLQLQQQLAQMQHMTDLEQSQNHFRNSHEEDDQAAYRSLPPRHRTLNHRGVYQSPSSRRHGALQSTSQNQHLPNRKTSITSDYSNYSQSRASSDHQPPNLSQVSIHSTETATRSNHSYPARSHASPRPRYRNAYPGGYHGQQPYFPPPPPAVARQPALYELQEEWLPSAYADFPTPGSEPHSVHFLPDSGVLPDTADPVYLAMTAPSPAGSHGSYGGSQISLDSLSQRQQQQQQQQHYHHYQQSHPAETVYQPGRVEMEHYDALYRDWNVTHYRVRHARMGADPSRSPSVQSFSTNSAAEGRGPPSVGAGQYRLDAPSPTLSSTPSGSSPVVRHSQPSSPALSQLRKPLAQQQLPIGQDMTTSTGDKDCVNAGPILPTTQAAVSKRSEDLSWLAPSNVVVPFTETSDSSPSLPHARAPQLWIPAATTDKGDDDCEATASAVEAGACFAPSATDEPLQIDDLILDIALGVDPQARVSTEQPHQPQEEVQAYGKQELSEYQESLLEEHLGDIDVPPVAGAFNESTSLSLQEHSSDSNHQNNTPQNLSSGTLVHNISQVPLHSMPLPPLPPLPGHTSLPDSPTVEVEPQRSQSSMSLYLPPPPLRPNLARPSLESLRSVASSATQRKKQRDILQKDNDERA
ncbi:hypothetical protein BGZ73_006166 [Actinomortierella ambigua]|nr:hypothetical protein BGZ73_006166 [Actinomortierella ambigua]